jgi:hypothetical protein
MGNLKYISASIICILSVNVLINSPVAGQETWPEGKNTKDAGVLRGSDKWKLREAGGQAVEQWASSVIGFSSQYSGWEAVQVLGPPDTFQYGDIKTAWAPNPKNGSREYIAVKFDKPVYAEGVVVRETYGNGFVYRIDVIDLNGNYHTVWQGSDPGKPGQPADSRFTWQTTDYQVTGVKIYTDTDHDQGAWEEIDAIKLIGRE